MGTCQSPRNREYISNKQQPIQKQKHMYISDVFSTTQDTIYTTSDEEETTSFRYSNYSTITGCVDIYPILNRLQQNGWSQSSLSSFAELLNDNDIELNDINQHFNEENESEIIQDFLNTNIQNNTIPKCALSDLKTIIRNVKCNPFQLQLTRQYSDQKLTRSVTNNADSTMNADDVRSFDEPFGSGSSCRVYKALYVPCGQLMALKVTSRLDYDNVRYILSECEQQNEVLPECEQLISIYGWYRNLVTNEIVVALEYMDMGSIYDSCFKNENIRFGIDHSGHKQVKIETLSYVQLRHITKQCLLGLEALHSNELIHCDIKPQNILASADGRVKIADFGLLCKNGKNEMCVTHKGTAKYFSPEKIKGLFNTATDLWSLGVTLIEIFNQKLIAMEKMCPFKIVENGIDLNEFFVSISAMPNDFVDFLKKCLEYDYKQRLSAELLLKHPFITGLDGDNMVTEQLCFCKQSVLDNDVEFDRFILWLEEWILDDIVCNINFFFDDNFQNLKLFVSNLANYSNFSSLILLNVMIIYIHFMQQTNANTNSYVSVDRNMGTIMRRIMTFLS